MVKVYCKLLFEKNILVNKVALTNLLRTISLFEYILQVLKEWIAMLKAIIFDFDGVIADTEPLHLKAFQLTLKENGIELSDEDYFEIGRASCWERV